MAIIGLVFGPSITFDTPGLFPGKTFKYRPNLITMTKCALQLQGEEMREPFRTRYYEILNGTGNYAGIPIAKMVSELKRIGLKASTGGVSQHRSNVCLCGSTPLFEGD